jgi:endonuclease/exonuclease/phosphatase (EEP) superfamily protein YafD
MAAVVVFAAFARRRRLAIVAAALALIASGPEFLISARARLIRSSPSAAGSPVLTLMSANLLYGRADPQRLLTCIHEHRPDVIVFQEWTPRSVDSIKPLLLADYPHWCEAARDDAFGQAVCSRRPFTRPPRVFPPTGGWREPQITVTLDLGDREVRITDVHILPPVDMTHFREQRRMAAGLAALTHPSDNSSYDGPHTDILAGDFNAVSRSAVLAKVLDTGMIEAHGSAPSRGRPRGATWPRTGLLRHTPGIRLDHVLHAPWLRCVETVVCDDVGSDHAPVVARLTPAPSATPD